jgi:site-specific DNA-methyltransferase (adenine-specific)
MSKPESMPDHKAITDEAKRWQGWGSALKPSYEPCIIVRKPLIGTMAENVLKFGCGGINIDGCRALPGDPSWPGPNEAPSWEVGTIRSNVGHKLTSGLVTQPPSPLGRWPANIYHCPKPSVAEREKGCDELSPDKWTDGRQEPADFPKLRDKTVRGNSHPTVKPIQLMRHLVKLVTPDGGVVLDPFAGSGSTLLAAKLEGFQFVGIEQEPKFCDITRARMKSLSEIPNPLD